MKDTESIQTIINSQQDVLDDISAAKSCVLKEYGIIPETINIVCQMDFEDFDKWIRDIFYGIKLYPEIIDSNYRLIEILEQLSLIMAYEQRSEPLLQDSLEKIAREATIDIMAKKKISRFFYEKDSYKSGKDIFEVHEDIDKIIKYALQGQDCISIFSRIKNYKSIINKCQKIIKRERPSTDNSEVTVDYIIETTGIVGKRIAITHSDYLDDLIGYNVIIDDSELTPYEAYTKMNKCASTVATVFKNKGFSTKKIQKDFRGKSGVTSFSVYIFGQLIHDKLGNLPIRIYFQLKSVMYNSHSMFYAYKTTGEWRQPPWLLGVDFSKMHSHRECRHTIFNYFKSYFQNFQNSQFYLENYLNIINNNPAIDYFSKLPQYSDKSIMPNGYSSALQNNYDNFNEMIGSRFGSKHHLNIATPIFRGKQLVNKILYLLIKSGYEIDCINKNIPPNSQDITIANLTDLRSEYDITKIVSSTKTDGITIILPCQDNASEGPDYQSKFSTLLRVVSQVKLDLVCINFPEINITVPNNLIDIQNYQNLMIIAKSNY